jgi:hypothetical protein
LYYVVIVFVVLCGLPMLYYVAIANVGLRGNCLCCYYVVIANVGLRGDYLCLITWRLSIFINNPQDSIPKPRGALLRAKICVTAPS